MAATGSGAASGPGLARGEPQLGDAARFRACEPPAAGGAGTPCAPVRSVCLRKNAAPSRPEPRRLKRFRRRSARRASARCSPCAEAADARDGTARAASPSARPADNAEACKAAGRWGRAKQGTCPCHRDGPRSSARASSLELLPPYRGHPIEGAFFILLGMPTYQRRGDVPRKRHIQFRDNGTLLTEEVMGLEGFSGNESILYHLISPCRVKELGDFEPIEREEWVPDAHAHRHFKTIEIEAEGDEISGRKLLMWNNDVEISLVPADRVDGLLLPERRGRRGLLRPRGLRHAARRSSATCRTARATTSSSRAGRPTGSSPQARSATSLFESPGLIEIPKRYRNEYGQLHGARALLPPGHPPADRAQDAPRPRRVHASRSASATGTRTTSSTTTRSTSSAGTATSTRGRSTSTTSSRSPGRIHMPPPSHQTFRGRTSSSARSARASSTSTRSRSRSRTTTRTSRARR